MNLYIDFVPSRRYYKINVFYKGNFVSSKETKDKILEACITNIIKNGIKDFTLEKIAKVAGVSKGGLLHHFKSKDDLITEVLAREISQMKEIMDDLVANDPKDKGRNARAYIKSLDYESSDEDISNFQKLWTAMLSCFVENPKVLKPIVEDNEILQNNIANDGLDEVDATIIKLAVDGLIYAESFDMKISKDMRKKVIDKLLKMTE